MTAPRTPSLWQKVPTPLKWLGVVALSAALILGPGEASARARGAAAWLRTKLNGVTPAGARLAEVEAKIHDRRVQSHSLRTKLAKMTEVQQGHKTKAEELRQRTRKRKVRIAAGEKILAERNGEISQNFDLFEIEQSLDSEREALRKDEKLLKTAQFRVEILERKSKGYELKLDEFDLGLDTLKRRLLQLREVEADNDVLRELVEIRRTLDEEFGLPDLISPGVAEDLADLEAQLKGENRALTRELMRGQGPNQNVLDRAVEAVKGSGGR